MLVFLLLFVFIRRRRQPAVATETHVAVPDYLDPRRKIKVPRIELHEPHDDQFYALHLGRARLSQQGTPAQGTLGAV